MTKAKRRGDGPTPGVRNWATGRLGLTRHSKASRAKKVESDAHRDDPDYPGYCWCGLRKEDCDDRG